MNCLKQLCIVAVISILGTVTVLWTSDILAEKWKPSIPEARMLIANEAKDVDGKLAWAVELRRGSGWPDRYVAKSNELSRLCERLSK